jgi:hypothetical protein
MHHMAKKLLLALCIVAAVFSGTAAITAGAAGNNLPNSFLIGDEDGIQVGRDGVYYIDQRKINPGDVFTKSLTIRNLEQIDSTPESKLPFTLTMTAEPLEESGPVKLLDAVHLNLKLDGKTIYDGRVRGDEGTNMVQNALALGQYASGVTRVLDITLTVDPNMELYNNQKSAADFAWHFYATRADATGSKTPKTGVDILLETLPYAIVGGTTLFCLFLVLKKRKRDAAIRAQANENA